MKRNFYWINLIGRFFCFFLLAFFLLAFFSSHSNAYPYPAYTAYLNTVQKIYIGYLQRPADPGGLLYWAARLDARSGNLNEIIEAFANSAESQTLYGTIDSSNISTVVDGIYNTLFCRDAEAAGLDFWVNGFNAGTFTAATIMLNILNGAQNEDLLSVQNKVIAAKFFTLAIDPELDGKDYQATYDGDADAQAGREFLSTVCWTVPTPCEITLFVKYNLANSGDPITASEIPFLNIYQGGDSGITEELTQVVRNEEAWLALWNVHVWGLFPVPSLPPIDFSKDMVIGIFDGQKASGGFEVDICSITENSTGQLIVDYTSVSPGLGCLVTMALTSPHQIVTLPYSNAEVIFRKNHILYDCWYE